MRGWIYNFDVGSYSSLMRSERTEPVIIQVGDEKTLVQMTANAMQAWMNTGYYFEFL